MTQQNIQIFTPLDVVFVFALYKHSYTAYKANEKIITYRPLRERNVLNCTLIKVLILYIPGIQMTKKVKKIHVCVVWVQQETVL